LGSALTLRKAGTGDSDFAYRTKRAAFRQYVEQAFGRWDEAEQRRLHDERFKQYDFRIANVAGTDVGFIAFTTDPKCVTLHHIFLLPEHQGKQIGRHCMARVRDEARPLGLPVRLRVLKVNPRARAFYERLGFTRIGETETHNVMEWPIGGSQ
jgi:GNAT superfamily N-acetyltransferase